MDRGCGLLRMGRLASETSLFYRPACGSKQCASCREKVLNRWMDRIPDDTALYGQVMHPSMWRTHKDQLARARARGEPGDYAHLPISDTQILVFSDAPIGEPISHGEIRDALDYTETEYGRLTTSRAWRKPAAPVERDEGSFRDDGVCRASWRWIHGKIDQEGYVETHREDRKRGYRTTEAQHAFLVDVASPVPDADYWAQINAGLTDAEYDQLDAGIA